MSLTGLWWCRVSLFWLLTSCLPSLCQQGTSTSWSATLCGGDCFSITCSVTAIPQPRRFLSGRRQPCADQDWFCLNMLVRLHQNCATRALGRTQIFPLFEHEPLSQMHRGSLRLSLHIDSSASVWALVSFLFILLQRWTGIFSSSKPKSTWKWVGGRVTLLVIFFLNERCSVEPPSYLSVQLCFGDQIHGPFTAGGITARGRSAQQTELPYGTKASE